MNNGDQSAFPLTFDAEMLREFDKEFKNKNVNVKLQGLTKREYFAIKALSALISNTAALGATSTLFKYSEKQAPYSYMANEAIIFADELLKQLSKPLDGDGV